MSTGAGVFPSTVLAGVKNDEEPHMISRILSEVQTRKNLHNVLSQRGSFHTFDDATHIGFKDVVLRFSTTSSTIQALNSKSLEVSPSAKRHKIRRVRRPKYILVKIKLRCRGNSVGGCGCFVGTGGSPKDQLSKGMGVDQPIRV